MQKHLVRALWQLHPQSYCRWFAPFEAYTITPFILSYGILNPALAARCHLHPVLSMVLQHCPLQIAATPCYQSQQEQPWKHAQRGQWPLCDYVICNCWLLDLSSFCLIIWLRFVRFVDVLKAWYNVSVIFEILPRMQICKYVNFEFGHLLMTRMWRRRVK